MNDRSNRADSEIIELYLTRDERAVSETDKKYGRELFRICYAILGDRTDAEECKNDTYVKAWDTIPKERPRNLLQYISRIARNKALDKYRSRKLKKNLSNAPAADELDELLRDRMAENENQAFILRDLLTAFVRNLPERRRYIFVGRYYAEQKVKTIAKKLKISEPTVYRELEEIKAELKQYLTENEVYI